MDFVANQECQIQEMLQAIGVASIEELFSPIPQQILKKAPVLDDGLSEYEGLKHMEALAEKNSFSKDLNFLGGGSYEHHVPAMAGALCSRAEFLTAYTPYQAEISQGMLQAIFEYQSAVCALTGLDVSNASVYDGASATAEAVLMALRSGRGRRRVIITEGLHPQYRKVLEQYTSHLDICIDLWPSNEDGTLIQSTELGEDVAALCLQSPNFFGVMENSKELFEKARALGIINILVANPMSYGLFPSSREQGADIACGDLQPLGLPMAFGGPYVDSLACSEELVRQLPGRIVGETVDSEGKKGYTLTLQAREQHIRREKATSNICSNQTLATIACLITILWYGPEGLAKVAESNYRRAQYLRQGLSKLSGVQVFPSENFNEFILRTKTPVEELIQWLHKNGIQGGIPLGRFYPERNRDLLVTVTEVKSKDQLDRYIKAVSEWRP